MRSSRRTIPALALAALLAGPGAKADEALLEASCGGCHMATDAGLSRIAGQRKTPEGWLMTIVRMRIAHGLEISPADQATLVAYLSETQGLAPAETAGWRYALEKDPSVVEAIEPPLDQMCARCHTGARFALQRRTAEEWSLHMDFHVGQYPTIEYQALGRDRDWYRLAKEEIAPLLSEKYPLETPEWTAWAAAEKPAVAGEWVVLTAIPGRGGAHGVLTVAGDASPYTVDGALSLADGTALRVAGQMNLYTGYEWRANLTVGDTAFRQVLAVSEDGTRLEGRQFLRDTDSLGARISGVRAAAGPVILGTVPEALPVPGGAVQIVGTGLEGLNIEGAGAADLAPNPSGVAANLSADANATATLKAGEAAATVSLYASVDRIAVDPPFTIARVGGGSDQGPPPVPVQFRAVGFWNGPDGQPETADDIRVGEVPATWSVGDHDETAAAMGDAKYAGALDPAGIFMPSVAGPNPERKYATNNAGDLKVTASAMGLTADARLIVTVQRWIDPPLR
ncbi:MAG TPA: quinohemoprotein amine dehydrogenase subunit alpha [Paracoccaceae bacterium]|nr:quinohemoprotein amine dehydrogenase subunit alpha [Paracoccaceae bacterium]